MKDYREILEFYYKNNLYSMFLDDANKKFFLKKEGNDWNYLTLEELIDLTVHLNSINPIPNALKEHKKSKFVPKVIIGGTAVTLSLATLAFGFYMYKEKHSYKYTPSPSYSSSFTYPDEIFSEGSTKINDYLSYEESTRPELKVDTERTFGSFHYIYDMAYLDNILNYKSVTLNDLNSVIDSNPNISPKYKALLKSYCKDVTSKYPNIELRVLYENLKTLEVVEKDKIGLSIAAGNADSYGCYKKTENKIYVPVGQDYEYGSWPHQVLYHEFSHCLRTGNWDRDGKMYRVQACGNNLNNDMLEEALNSVFAVSLYNYEERDIAYQLQSNYNKVMIECLGSSYTMDDYVNHSLSYYASKLNEYNNDDNAIDMIELMTMQYDAYYGGEITVSQDQLQPLYEYISNMYFKKYITSNMSYEQAKEVASSLVDKIMYDVPAEYNIDTNNFYEYLDNYCENIGISRSGISR